MVLPENIMVKLKLLGVNMKILRFTASWCQPCKMLAKNLEGATLGVPIEVVDIDVFPDVAMDYGIRSVPTLVCISETGMKKLVGVKSVQEIKDWINT